ncbi:hypothetical protein [Acidipropionibacterium timonense]|uniref:hypothetical protein n=1 Tax=Acidipropionibacterium timonense TaxID=2161818 RepID=UPI001030A719|nr:hypothetical protein [Acidipropionibacterium timonense]
MTLPTSRILAALSGTTFALFPVLRPWSDKDPSGPGLVEAFASPLWSISHILGMAGWVGLAGVTLTSPGPGRRWRWMVPAGVAALLPYYGAEAFGLHGMALSARASGDTSGIDTMAALVRHGAEQSTLFGLGLVLAGAGSIGWAMSRRDRGRWTALAASALVALYLPQFFAPPTIRIVHGLCLGLALVTWAAVSGRSPSLDDRHAEDGALAPDTRS